MFYSLIEKKRDEWFNSSECTVNELITYIEAKGKLRDAQIDAIKTYLFLKIKCGNKSLWQLFYEGAFNTIDINQLEIKQQLKEFFAKNPCALSLYQYAVIQTGKNKDEILSPKLEKEIKDNFDSINYKKIFQDIFNNVQYTDYLYSLPMGAGKTFLMASFIYLDLYFAQIEPSNKSFSHNFMIFAPSGLKSSIIPSLKTIQKFDPSWIIPEPAASNIKRLIKFEILDQTKTDNKSNKIKNPNVQKIAQYQPYEDLFGLVAITNAEKVILDDTLNYDENQILLLSKTDLEKYKTSNELRSLIAKIPNLSIFIDEVHHTVKEENRLRTVVTDWTKSGHFNSVVGFSGTPYLEKANMIKIKDNLVIRNKDITNVVYYYALINGIGNFLKRPVVRISNSNNSLEIAEYGIREFLDKYQNKIYANGTCAKIALYCGSIKNLEEKIYPKVCEIIRETKYNLNPDEVVLKFYRGTKEYPEPPNAQLEFDSLDKSISKIKIVLLVQIGKEGWDCKSLTGVILTQESDCKTNMILQTSCRCLRQVDKFEDETAIIYLNEGNARILNEQLQKQQHIGINEFQSGGKRKIYQIYRYNRMDKKNLPPIDFYQLRVHSDTLIVKESNISKLIKEATQDTKYFGVITTQNFKGELIETNVAKECGAERAYFNLWLYNISKSSFNTITLQELYKYEKELKSVFDEITYQHDKIIYFSSKYDTQKIEANIRKAFSPTITFETREEIIPDNANLLIVEKLTNPIETFKPESFIPTKDDVEAIIKDDHGELSITEEVKTSINVLRANGLNSEADKLEQKYKPNANKDKTYHYLPYKTDSEFEQKFLNDILASRPFKDKKLEVYYNGDEVLTEFTIKTYKWNEHAWVYLGNYTPDFIILKRTTNKIDKVLIVETKGEGFAKNFAEKKNFMEKFFIPKNNEKFGYEKFEFLYLQDDVSNSERINITIDKIEKFFKENI